MLVAALSLWAKHVSKSTSIEQEVWAKHPLFAPAMKISVVTHDPKKIF